MHKLTLAFASSLVLSCLAASAAAQCAPVVQEGPSLLGFDVAPVTMVEWDPDGAGPLGLHWVFGGAFAVAGDLPARGVAMFDPASGLWSSLGNGPSNVKVLLPLPNGQLLAAESTQYPPSSFVWLWDGSSWGSVGGTPNGPIAAMARLPNGDVVVGGSFSTAGGQGCSNVAGWDGTNWYPLGGGVSAPAVAFWSGFVHALMVDWVGDLWVGGWFDTAGGAPAQNVARWNGVTWSPVGAGLVLDPNVTTGGVLCLQQIPSGDVVAFGNLASTGGQPLQDAARWTGSSWVPMGQFHVGGGGLDALGSVSTGVGPTGELVAIWTGALASSLQKWNGTSWVSPAAHGPSLFTSCLATSGGSLLVTGNFTSLPATVSAPARRADRVVLLESGGWSPIAGSAVGLQGGNYLFGSVRGTTVAVGTPSWAGMAPVAGAAVRVNGSWTPLAGSPRLNSASATCNLPNGDLLVGGAGQFFLTSSSGVGWQLAGPLVRFDGTTWSGFGGYGLLPDPQGATTLTCLLPLADGSVAVGGSFGSIAGVGAANLARWNGTTWLPFGSGTNGEVRTMVQLPNGDLVVAGRFTVAGGVPCTNVARWDGSTWSPIGAGIGGPGSRVDRLVLLPKGELLATGELGAGASSALTSVARWDNGAWVDATFGYSMKVMDMVQLPSREVLLATYRQFGPYYVPTLLIGNGVSAWRNFSAQPPALGYVVTEAWKLTVTTESELFVRGPFTELGGVSSVKMASILPGCPAVVNVVGSGCAGSGGQDTLTSEVLPWLGGVARARATGLPAEAWVVVALGVATANVPLATLSPLAVPGCDVRTSLDFYVLANVTGGSVPIDLPLPLTPSLVGASLFEQVLSLGLSGGAPFEATSTNALELQLGLFGG